MTNLIDRLAWEIYVRTPYTWSRPRWLVVAITNRVGDAMLKRNFNPK